MESMTYEKIIERFDLYPKEKRMEAYALGIASEAGEVAGKIKKYIRNDWKCVSSLAVAQELGDVLWYLTRMASEMGYSLEALMELNYLKLSEREQKGTLRGDGDGR